MNNALEHSTPSENLHRRVFHPSPAFIAAPFFPAVALFLTGAYRGGLAFSESLPALLLLVTTYLISRWYRHSPLVVDETGMTLRDVTVRFDDVGSVRPDDTPRRNRWRTFQLLDRNNAERLCLSPAAYGAGQNDLIQLMEQRLGNDVLPKGLIRPQRGPVRLLWTAALVLVAAALLHNYI